MKTKEYRFTIAEMIAIRDSLIEERQRLRIAKCSNNQVNVLNALKDQFKQDVALWHD